VQFNDKNRLYKDSTLQKPLRYSKDSFVKELIGKVVKITISDGSLIQGRLLELGMYDILIQTSASLLIIFKSRILTVEVI
jgi:hypothetical protein